MYELHLTSDEFWHLTFAQYDAMAKRYREEQDWLNYRAALVCSVLVNTHRDPKKGKASQPKDFMPKKPVKKSNVELSPDAMKQRLEIMAKAFGGEVKE